VASAQENVDKLTQTWLAEGRALPLLGPMERPEIYQFGERCGISKLEMLEVMRVLVENAERAALEADWGRVPRA
jgi:hypothetical protein